MKWGGLPADVDVFLGYEPTDLMWNGPVKGGTALLYEKVKAKKGAPGVDAVSLAELEKDLKNNLYKIWNRMSQGRIFRLRCVPWRS